jgi:hypothetical protein
MTHKRERFYGATPPTSFFPLGAHGGWFLNVPKSIAEFGRCCAQQSKRVIMEALRIVILPGNELILIDVREYDQQRYFPILYDSKVPLPGAPSPGASLSPPT